MEYDSENEFYPAPRKKPYIGNEYEIYRTKKRLIMKEEYRKLFNNSTTLYQFLLSNIVRGDTPSDVFGIKRKYYDKGFLACSLSERTLAKKCFISKGKVYEYIKNLEKADVIEVKKIKSDNYQTQNVYILGTWQFIEGKKSERLYLDEVFDM